MNESRSPPDAAEMTPFTRIDDEITYINMYIYQLFATQSRFNRHIVQGVSKYFKFKF